MNMKKRSFPILILLLCGLLLMQGCIKLDEGGEDQTQDPTTGAEDETHYYEDATYVYQSQVDEAVLTTNLSPAYLILANKENMLGAEYVPAPLVKLTCTTLGGKAVELEDRAARALYAMLSEMYAQGVTDIMVTSGYRSYSYQVSLNSHYLSIESGSITADAYKHFGSTYIKENYLDKGLSALSPADAEAVVRSYSAEPGKSEHQTGLCVDFITSTMSALDTSFEKTAAFSWLKENAYKFGFILRYPDGKESVTGYTYEPWHYRFVGREAATDIYFADLTLEEYLSAVEE